jgi:hypothetical protein
LFGKWNNVIFCFALAVSCGRGQNGRNKKIIPLTKQANKNSFSQS